jgi:hypothetical protein
MMLSNIQLLAGQGHTPPARVAEFSRPGPSVIMSPPPSRKTTSASTRSTRRHATVRPPVSSSPSAPSAPSAPLFDAVVSAFFEQLRHSVDDFSENQHWRMVGGWQAQGMPDEVIYDTLQTLFPDHGSPLTLYEELYLPALSGKGLTPMRQTKPSVPTQQGQREKSQLPFTRSPLATGPATTPLMYPKPPPAPRMLHQLLNPQQSLNDSINSNNNKVSVVINVGDYVNVRAANSQGLHSRGGNGYVACKETVANGNGIDFVFTVTYVDAFLSGGQSLDATESKITRDRLTVLPPSPYLTLGNPKQGQGIVTAAPDQQPPEIKPPKIAINRHTVHKLAPAPLSADSLKRKGSTVTPQSSKDGDEDSNDNNESIDKAAVVYDPPTRLNGHENLAEHLQKSHSLHRAKGWRQDDFADVDLGAASVKRKLLLQDVMWMEHYLNKKGRRKGPKQAKGDSFNSNSFVRNNKSKSSNKINDDDNDDGTNRSEKIHPLTMRYLAYSWGIGKNTPKELLKRANVHSVGAPAPGVGSIASNPEVWKQRSVIECRRTALKHYSAKHLYIHHRITERRRLSTYHELEKYNKREDDDEDNDNDDPSTSSGSFLTYQYRQDIKADWDALDAAAREPWEQKAKWHDEIQPSIQRILTDEINNNPYRTYQELASGIGDWCGASTIQRWLTAKNAPLKEE